MKPNWWSLWYLRWFEYPDTANLGVEGSSWGDFSVKVLCYFDKRIIWPISQTIARARRFVSIFQKMTFRACLQFLAKSWWCTVYGERTGFLRWWLISCQICFKKPLQFCARDFMLLWFIIQDINGDLSGFCGTQSKIRFFSYRENTNISHSQNTLSCP